MNSGLKMASPVWEDYELVDSGDFEKLERFGRYLLRRPEPQAIWRKSLSEEEWRAMADGSFRREGRDEERGGWSLRRGMVEQWCVAYPLGSKRLTFRLGLTSFKHVGLFPEQADNWEFIYSQVTALAKKLGRAPRVLNLFAYTGGASLAAAAAGADVTHVDSVRQVVTWARENMEQSNLNGIRWVVEDALKFVRREVKRGHYYDGIILDPPAYGRGPDGEKWVLEQNIGEMLDCCSQLLDKQGGFAVLNLYSMGLSAMLARSAMCQLFPKASSEQFGELYFTDRFEKSLPLVVYYRATYGK